MQALLSSDLWKSHRKHVLKLQELDWSGFGGGGSPWDRRFFNWFYWLWFLICFTVAASRQNVPKRPTPCPKRKSGNSQEELIAKLIFFSRASRGVSLFCPRPGLSSPMKAFPIMCPGLKLYFFPALRAGDVFLAPDASFPTTRMPLPGLPHEQICSTWASSRTELLYLGLPTNRSCLPELPHEQNNFTWGSPRTELQVANLFLEVILFVGKPR